MKQKRRDAPRWVFPWKRRGEPVLPKFLAVAFSAAVFAGLFGFVRIQTSASNPWGLKKAAVIHVLDTPEGRALALEAREAGPSPVRLSISDWPSLKAFEDQQLARVSAEKEEYQPRLRDWMPEPAPAPMLSQPGTMVLPPLPVVELKEPPVPPGPLQPVVWPLSGLTVEEVPSELPRYDGAVDAAMQADSVRFLIRVDGDGQVVECIALSGGDTPEGTAALGGWVRGIRFLRKPEAGIVWAAIRIRFLNQSR